MSTRRIATGLATGCLAVLVAGCGSSGSSPASPLSGAAYRSALHQVAHEEGAAQNRVQAAFHARTVAQLRKTFAAFAADQRRVAARLGALTPPRDAAAANAELAKAFGDNAAAMQQLVSEISSTKTVHKALHIVQADKAAQRVGAEIDTALDKLKKLGYTTGS
jgi:hypothetical protein